MKGSPTLAAAGLLLLAGNLPAAEPTIYNCLATQRHVSTGTAGMHSEPMANTAEDTPRFGLDLRNAAIFGSLLPEFGQGELMIRQAAPEQPWTAWWILRDGPERRVDMLTLLPPRETATVATFLALHREALYTGFCVDASESPSALGEAERLGR